MKEPGISRQFILVCIAVLLGSYGVGLGIKKIRFAGAEAQTSTVSESGNPVDKSDDEKTAAEGNAPAEPSEKAEQPAAEPGEEAAARPEQFEGRRMRGGAMSERFQNMSEQERQAAIAEMRERARMRMEGRGRGGGAFSQMSDEDRENFRAEMEALNARAGEMSEDQMRQARNEILEKYGLPTGGRGGRRRFGSGGGDGGGGEAPVKGRACFVPQTPVWIEGKLIEIAKVTAGRTIGMNSRGSISVAQLQEHEGTFECRDIVLDSGSTIGVVCSHYFMLESGKWIAAQNLTAGLKLKTRTGTVAVKNVTKRTVPYTGKVYNLKIKNSSRYFIGKDVIIVRDY